jgi:L-lactate dehydrogenase
MKLGIIGGSGRLGSATAFLAGVKGLVPEIKLADINKNLLKSHVLDMNQALSAESNVRAVEAEYADLAGCGILLLTAALPERSASSRNDYLAPEMGNFRRGVQRARAEHRRPVQAWEKRRRDCADRIAGGG